MEVGSEKQNKSAEEQKEERWDEREWLEANLVNNENSKGESGEALERRKEGIGKRLEIWVFQ